MDDLESKVLDLVPSDCTCFVDSRIDLDEGEWLTPADNPCKHHRSARRVKT